MFFRKYWKTIVIDITTTADPADLVLGGSKLFARKLEKLACLCLKNVLHIIRGNKTLYSSRFIHTTF